MFEIDPKLSIQENNIVVPHPNNHHPTKLLQWTVTHSSTTLRFETWHMQIRFIVDRYHFPKVHPVESIG